ncbi:MAG TPA: Asp-tRNA(Asn)/Glu-tRNA(Gln) amidotransferase subunit GatB [Gemmatimonadaceae bacterium]|jgi:aspartyl-tRNA(Asn)/glutamyl-tRNA(Gln) amidotransferase subunit B|nr:Asp-tRNA(Asn)/Glu-tRNA(Gln) amidotransferase subunit GatB [Gemmatimonadaceae bacterium]
MTDYEMVVGLEVHVQLKTANKAFCNCPTTFGAAPNVNTCPVCLALPGSLPVLNARAVELAVRAALALDSTVHETSVFARKNYFYPDLPKGYQISQYDRPLATGGFLMVGDRKVNITRVHMEEDAGKSVHDRYTGVTAIDLNRAGVPLIEIVSEPDMRSAQEARRYLQTLKQVLEYVEVSDVDMEKGSLRVDANVSARPRGSTTLGTKTEVKNMNSFSGVERALESEFARQVAVLESGGRVVQQTMLWDGAKGEVRPARSKEQSHDYRYFPEPDLPPLRISEVWVADQLASLPELPAAVRARFALEYGLDEQEISDVIADTTVSRYFEEVARGLGDSRLAINWVRGEVMAALNAGRTIPEMVPAPRLVEMLAMVKGSVISNSAAKTVFEAMLRTGSPAGALVDQLGLRQVGDDGALRDWIAQARSAHPTEFERYAAGEKKLKGVLIKYVMDVSNRRADPKRLNQLLDEDGKTV